MGHSHGSDGAHTHGSGSGLGTAVLVILGAALLASAAGPFVAAVAELVRAVLIALAVIAGIGVLGLAGFVVYRLREAAADRAAQARRPAGLHDHAKPVLPQQTGTAALAGRDVPAIGRPAELHLHFHGVTADEVAEVLARVNREDL